MTSCVSITSTQHAIVENSMLHRENNNMIVLTTLLVVHGTSTHLPTHQNAHGGLTWMSPGEEKRNTQMQSTPTRLDRN